MEKQLFEWEELIECEPELCSFGKVTLKVPIGKWPAGTFFETASVNWSEGTLEFWTADGIKIDSFELELKVK